MHGSGMRVGPIPVLAPPIYLHFKNHCILCLQPQAPKLLQIVRENPKDLKNFRPIIHYLTGTDPSHDKGRVECELVGIPTMESLPPMCPSCYDILAEMYRLHEQLLNVQLMIQKQTELAREVVAKGLRIPPYSVTSASTPTPRQKFHDKIQCSLMSPMDSKRVISFVDNLHNKMVAEALSKKMVVFPTLETLQPRISNQAPVPAPPPEVLMPDPLADDPSMAPSSSFTGNFPSSSALTSPPSTSLHAGQTSTPSETYYGYRPENHQPTEESESEDLKYEVEGSEFGNDDGDIDFEPEVSDCEEKDVKDNELYFSSEASSSPGPSTSDKHLSSVSGNQSTKKRTEEREGSQTSSPPTKKKKPSWRDGSTSTRIPTRPLLIKSEDGISQHCDICGKLVHSSEIENHLITKHNLQGYITKCPNPSCPSVFSCLGKLEKHLITGRTRENKCFRAAKSYPYGALYSRNCEVCDFRADHVSDFRWHLRKHETEMAMSPRLACPITGCLERFALRQSVEEHLCMRHRNEKSKLRTVKIDLVNGVRVLRVQKCDLCEKWILFTDIIQHLEGHNVKEYITKCPNPECEHVFSCVGQMKHHFTFSKSRCRRKTEPPGLLKCNACDFEVASATTFRKHLLVHENREEKAISCPIADCSEKFALRQSVEDHLMSHGYLHRNKMKNFSERTEQKCAVCEELIKIEELAKHFTEAHKVEMDKITKCSYCPFLFPNWESFLKHLCEHRSMTKDGLSCHICNDSRIKFYKFEALCQHLFNVHQLGKQYLCEHCDVEFFFHQSLTSHVQRAHSIDETTSVAKNSQPKQTKKPLQCDKCPDTFMHRDTLNTHQMKVHGAPPVTCKFCPSTFLAVAQLRKHEATHTGLKRSYKCRVEGCPRVYPSMYKWRIHMTNAHNPDPEAPKGQNLVCDICGLSLASNRSLRNHQLIHSGERPHMCSICGQGFRTRSVLGTHLKAHQEKGESFKPNGPKEKGSKRVAKTNE